MDSKNMTDIIFANYKITKQKIQLIVGLIKL